MFTGLIETIGLIGNRRMISGGIRFRIDSRFDSEDLRGGESIAVDGICVTVEDFDQSGFSFTASEETLQRSTIAEKKIGQKVHLERALRLGDRLGGHLVQGHVDGIGRVIRLKYKGTGADLTVAIPETLGCYVVEKGSLAVQGVSLTVAEMRNLEATFALIPATLSATYLGDLAIGEHLNLEVDILAKYVESLLSERGGHEPLPGGVDEEKLRQWGFS